MCVQSKTCQYRILRLPFRDTPGAWPAALAPIGPGHNQPANPGLTGGLPRAAEKPPCAAQNVTFRCVAGGTASADGAIMEDIAPPMPAERALAALDQPAPADTGPPKRISKKVRAAIDAMVYGDCKKIVEAAARRASL